MAEHYKEAPWWWYIAVLVFSFVLGLVVVIKENITLPAWAYVVALIVGIFIAPLVNISILALSNYVVSNFDNRVPFYTLATVTVLPPTTCPRCWLV